MRRGRKEQQFESKENNNKKIPNESWKKIESLQIADKRKKKKEKRKKKRKIKTWE